MIFDAVRMGDLHPAHVIHPPLTLQGSLEQCPRSCAPTLSVTILSRFVYLKLVVNSCADYSLYSFEGIGNLIAWKTFTIVEKEYVSL
jgi:hypothetical protein